MTLYPPVDSQGWQAEDESWKGRQILGLLRAHTGDWWRTL